MASACELTWWIPISDQPSPHQTELRIGRLTKAHGLKGALKVELYTDDPARRFVPGAVFQLQVPTESVWHGKTIELAELKWYNSHAVAFFKNVVDRDGAESLVKAILWVHQDAAELPEEDDAWYDHQLVGLAVVRDGATVGVVARVDHMPAQDLLAVTTDAGEVLVPFIKAFVPAVDIAAKTVTVTPPLGLFEEIPDDGISEQPAPSDDAVDAASIDTADEPSSPASVDDLLDALVVNDDSAADDSAADDGAGAGEASAGRAAAGEAAADSGAAATRTE